MIAIERRRRFQPTSNFDARGGLYNPGAWRLRPDAPTQVLLRREAAYPFLKRPSLVPLYWCESPGILGTVLQETTIIGHHADARLEDFRPILFQDQVIVAHTSARDDQIKPVLSLFDPEARTLTRWDDFHLPIRLAPVEKNWVLATDGDTLYTVYALDPFTVFFFDTGHVWRRARLPYRTDWNAAVGKPPRNSCNLLPFAGGYLGWWHLIFDRWYVQGAYWVDWEFSDLRRTGILFDGQDVTDGFKPGVLYLSSQVDRGDRLELWFGEGDAFTSVATVEKREIAERLGVEGDL